MRSFAVSQQQRKPHRLDGKCTVNQLTDLEKIPCTLQLNTRSKAHYFNNKLSRDGGRDAIQLTGHVTIGI